ncbi:MAG: glycoside hydrolase family 16 protein [Lachnospiraceae bacterium]|nr:glycoside hydrolase family 16 protein [Lachnospiraceae bacterium]
MSQKKSFNRLLSFVLSLAMIFTSVNLPGFSIAANAAVVNEDEGTATCGATYDSATGKASFFIKDTDPAYANYINFFYKEYASYDEAYAHRIEANIGAFEAGVAPTELADIEGGRGVTVDVAPTTGAIIYMFNCSAFPRPDYEHILVIENEESTSEETSSEEESSSEEAPVLSPGVTGAVDENLLTSAFVTNSGNGGEATYSNVTESSFDVTVVAEGEQTWSNQVFQENLALADGQAYKLIADAACTADAKVYVNIQESVGYSSLFYKDKEIDITGGEVKHIEFITKPASGNFLTKTKLVFMFGKDSGDEGKTITLSNIKLVPYNPTEEEIAAETSAPVKPFEADYDAMDISGFTPYVEGTWGGSSNCAYTFGDNNTSVTFTADNFGWDPWATQLQNVSLSSGSENNVFEFDIVASSDRTFVLKQETGTDGITETISLQADKVYHYAAAVNKSAVSYTFDLHHNGGGSVTIRNMKFAPVLKMSDIEVSTYNDSADGGWGGSSNVVFTPGDTEFTISGDNFGGSAWATQLAFKNMTSTKEKNTFAFDVVCTTDKSFVYKNENTEKTQEITLKANVPYHFSENIDKKTFGVTYDLAGGSGVLKFYNVRFGDMGVAAVNTSRGPEYDFTDVSGNNANDFAAQAQDHMGDDWQLVFADEFDGQYGEANVDAATGLNLDNWMYQYGDGTIDCGNAGWGNKELQAYTGDPKNIKVNEDLNGDAEGDGLLRITAHYEDEPYVYTKGTQTESGKKYTSARIRSTSPEKELFNNTYGYVEARISLPETAGAWPAFWMLPESTSVYGGWPVSGEIDIMETTGTNTSKACGTLHYGAPAHVYKGSGYVDLSSNIHYFHTYAVDWEPGKMTWYYDGEPINTLTDWKSGKTGASDALSFDAPFDQPFYMLLNLAVDSGQFGGDSNKAKFQEDINMYVDYVRVYQKKDGYVDSVVRSAGTAAGDDAWKEFEGKNQIVDITADSLSNDAMGDEGSVDMSKWFVATQSDATASGETVEKNGATWAKIDITKGGSNDYSVQLIGHYDAKKDFVYKVTYDMYAEGGMVGKTVNCDSKEWKGWSSYGIKSFTLTDKPATYGYTFKQTEDFEKCRIEFNIGSQGTGTVYISNVKVEIVDPETLGQAAGGRQPLEDGNVIFNGSFDQGDNHLGYWKAGANTEAVVPRYTSTDLTGNDVSVIDVASKINYEKDAVVNGVKYYERRAQLTPASATSSASIYQGGIKLPADKYTVKFDMYSTADTTVQASICKTAYEGEILVDKLVSTSANYEATSGVKTYTFELDLTDDLKEGGLLFTFGKGAAVQIDNVTMIGAGQRPVVDEHPVRPDGNYNVDGAANANNEGGVLTITDIVSGSTWYSPQIIGDNFQLSNGIKYRLSFKYKFEDGNKRFDYIVQENGGSWKVFGGGNGPTAVEYDSAEADENGFCTYTKEFTADASMSTVHLVFGFGNSELTDAAKGTAVIKNITLDAFDVPGGGDTQYDNDEDNVDQATLADTTLKEGIWADAIEDQIFTGSAIKPEIDVYDGNVLLVAGKDYKVTYKNNTNAGTATVTIQGKGNYKNTTEKVTFKIKAKKISEADVTVADIQAVINAKGVVKIPKVTAKYNKKTLKVDKDYTVNYPVVKGEDGKAVAGTYDVEITGKGNYTGTRVIKFTAIANGKLNLAKATVTVDPSKVDYSTYANGDVWASDFSDGASGEVKTTSDGAAVITVGETGTNLWSAQYYTLLNLADTTANFKVVGKITADKAVKVGTNIQETNWYNGFVAADKQTINIAAGQTVDFEVPAAGAWGDQLKFVLMMGDKTDCKGATIKVSDVKVVTVATEEVPSKEIALSKNSLNVTVKAGKETLVSGTDYVAYIPNADAVNTGKANEITVVALDGGKAYGTKTASLEVTGSALNAKVYNMGIDTPADGFVYTGDAIEPAISVSGNNVELVAGTDYTVEYSKNVKAGKATVKAVGKKAFAGTLTKTFVIAKADMSKVDITVAPSADYNKNGAQAAYTISYNGRELEYNKDYKVTYKNNKALGKATITFAGKGNFVGSVTKEYDVVAPAVADIAITADDMFINASTKAIKTKVVVKEAATGKVLASGKDYKDLKYYKDAACTIEATAADIVSDNVVYAQVTLAGNYGTAKLVDSFRFYTVKATTLKVDAIPVQEYTGEAVKPAVVVKNASGTVLVEGVDYTVSYGTNVNKGNGTVIITGAGNGYGGSKTVKFKIGTKNLNFADWFKNLFK